MRHFSVEKKCIRVELAKFSNTEIDCSLTAYLVQVSFEGGASCSVAFLLKFETAVKIKTEI